MNPRNTLKKTERLKSRKSIDRLFREGKSFSVFPFKVFYVLEPANGGARALAAPKVGSETPIGPEAAVRKGAPLQAGFGVSSRLFRKAVDRNRIKRLSREAWRLQRHSLSGNLLQKGRVMSVFLLYTGKQLPDYPLVTQKIGVALQKLIKEA
jgi:ribonuclease P protein component